MVLAYAVVVERLLGMKLLEGMKDYLQILNASRDISRW